MNRMLTNTVFRITIEMNRVTKRLRLPHRLGANPPLNPHSHATVAVSLKGPTPSFQVQLIDAVDHPSCRLHLDAFAMSSENRPAATIIEAHTLTVVP